MRTFPVGLMSFFCMLSPSRAADVPVYPDRAKLLIWKDANGKEHSVNTPADWAKRRAHVLANMEKVMGPLPDASRKVPLDVQVTEEVKGDGFFRKKLTYAAEKGDHASQKSHKDK